MNLVKHIREKALVGLALLVTGCPFAEAPTSSEYNQPTPQYSSPVYNPPSPTVYNPPQPTQPPPQPPNTINRHSTTGINGLNTVDQIENHPRVASAIREFEDFGYNFALFSEPAINPPNIEGSYRITGETVTPYSGDIIPGGFHWNNQTYDNHIRTDFSQFFGGLEHRGVSSLGEIIRGNGNGFTVYSIINVSENNGCDFTVAVIMSGEITASRNLITGLYCSAVLEQDPICEAMDSAGTFVLERR